MTAGIKPCVLNFNMAIMANVLACNTKQAAIQKCIESDYICLSMHIFYQSLAFQTKNRSPSFDSYPFSACYLFPRICSNDGIREKQSKLLIL